MRFYSLLLLFFSLTVLGQNQDVNQVLNAGQVAKMAVFPGCEIYHENKDLRNCFAKRIAKNIAKRFNVDRTDPFSIPKRKYSVFIEFIVTKDGYLDDFAYHSGDKEIAREAIRTLVSTSQYLKNNNLVIQPAISYEGKPVSLSFRIPVSFINTGYKESDWIDYYFKEGNSVQEILIKLKDKQGISNFTEEEVKEHLSIQD